MVDPWIGFPHTVGDRTSHIAGDRRSRDGGGAGVASQDGGGVRRRRRRRLLALLVIPEISDPSGSERG